MLRIFLDALPFAIAGALTPAWILMAVALLGTGRPTANASLFVSGIAAARLVTAGLAVFLLEVPRLAVGPGPMPGPVASGVFAALAAVAFAFAGREFGKRREPVRGFERWRNRFDRMRPAASFGLGALVEALPGAQYIYLLGGADAIAAGNLDVASRLVVLVAFVAVLQALLVALIVVHLALGQGRSQRLLGRTAAWLSLHGHAVNGVVLALVGSYLLVRAWPGLSAVLPA